MGRPHKAPEACRGTPRRRHRRAPLLFSAKVDEVATGRTRRSEGMLLGSKTLFDVVETD